MCGTGLEALTSASELQPSVVLLDIRMPGMSGIEAARHLSTLPAAPAVVFTTAYDEYAMEAFDAQAIGYLLKPVRKERLERALRQAGKLSASQLKLVAAADREAAARQHIAVRVRDELRLIPVKDIQFFRADQKYVCVHHAHGQDLIDESLKSLETEFADDFVRIHRGAVVAVDKIERLEKTTDDKHHIVLRDEPQSDDELIISRRHLADVRRRLKGG